jgi:hypothetical protein
MDSQNFKDDVKHVRTNDGVGKEKNKFLAIIVVFLVIIIVLAGVLIAVLLNSKKEESEEERRTVLVTEENAEEVADELFAELEKPKLGPDYYTVTMEPVWHFREGDQESYDAVVVNVESNAAPVYFDVFLEEDESHVLYKSPIIPLGGELRNIKLDEDLDAGNYACVTEFHLLGEDQKTTISTVRVGITIVVNE